MTDAPIDMSLRLWSDEIALAPIVRDLGLQTGQFHVRGEPIPPSRGAASRIARRHYASIAHERGYVASDVDEWILGLVGRVRSNPLLVRLLETRQVEATFWLAILGKKPLPMPRIDRHLIEQAAALSVNIFTENYTELVDGNPGRRWLPEIPAATAFFRSV